MKCHWRQEAFCHAQSHDWDDTCIAPDSCQSNIVNLISFAIGTQISNVWPKMFVLKRACDPWRSESTICYSTQERPLLVCQLSRSFQSNAWPSVTQQIRYKPMYRLSCNEFIACKLGVVLAYLPGQQTPSIRFHGVLKPQNTSWDSYWCANYCNSARGWISDKCLGQDRVYLLRRTLQQCKCDRERWHCRASLP